MEFLFHRKEQTGSTNADARAGRPGDVFVTEFQTAGRGRLDHRWLSAHGEGLMFSVVLDVAGVAPAETATLPLVVGLSVVQAVRSYVGSDLDIRIKWPNDLLLAGRKACGILCERNGDCVIAGVGLNVNQVAFPDELAARATSLRLCTGRILDREAILRDVLGKLDALMARWRRSGFAAIREELDVFDGLKGKTIAVRATDGDCTPTVGLCGGIQSDGSLLVGARRVYAGEAHVLS